MLKTISWGGFGFALIAATELVVFSTLGSTYGLLMGAFLAAALLTYLCIQ